MGRTPSRPILALLLATTAVAWARSAHANGILVSASPGAVAAEPSGRRAGPVSLVGHDVRARVKDRIAHVTVEQVFHNASGAELEGTYLFPLPQGAVVSQFAMTMGGAMVEGEVIEAEEARRIYHGIVRRRRDPGLLEYVGRGLYRARVFPILPHGNLTIRLAYQQVLPEDEGVIELRYPLASDRFGAEPVERVRVDVQIESSVDVKGLYSPSHPLAVTREGERQAHVTLERSGRRQTKDLLLYVARSPDAVGLSVLSHKAPGEDGTFMAVLAPRTEVTDAARAPKDVVYVLDTSGSMAGEKLTQAQAALTYGVRMLRAGDRFNIIAFSNGIRPFRDGLVAAGSATSGAAATWIEGLRARGGTNIERALIEALGQRSEERLFLIVFLTDGRPTVGERNVRALVARLKAANKKGARVCTFGVGYDLDVELLDRVAAVTRGTRDYVAPGEDIEIVTGRFFRRVDQPVLTDVTVDLGPGMYDVYPQEMPDLFAGGQVVVYGRYREAGARTLSLAGRLGGARVTHVVDAVLAADERADFLPRLWAHRKVAFLLDAIRLNGEEKELVDEVVRLATRHAIVTPYTAALVVEEEELERGGLRSENPLFQIGGRAPRPPRTAGGRGGFYRRPNGSVPPGLREPTDATPPPPPPPSGPPTTPPPSVRTPMTPMPPTPPTTPDSRSGPRPTAPAPSAQGQAAASKDLRRRKEAEAEVDEAAWRAIKEKIRTVADKTFVLRRDGRWVDTAWDGKQETVTVEAFTPAYFELLEKGTRISRYLAVGRRVVLVVGKTAYEIVLTEK